jgi:outer membrane protein assembly factor BamB
VNTSNGPDENHEKTPNPKAANLIAIDKKTGKLAWKADSPGKLYDGQWSSPAIGKIGDDVQVVIGGGDGWVRGHDALKGTKLWEFDTNPKGVPPKGASIVIATPVIWEGKVYVANGQDPESGQGLGALYAIDPAKRGDVTTTGLVWRYGEIKRSVSSVAIYNGVLFAADLNGFLHGLDVGTGKAHWTHDMMAAIWGSPMVIDGKVYVGTADGDVVVLEAARTKRVVFQANMGSNVYSTFVPANGALFLTNRNTLFALATQ